MYVTHIFMCAFEGTHEHMWNSEVNALRCLSLLVLAWFVESLTECRAQPCMWEGCSVSSWCLLVSASWVLGSQVWGSTPDFRVSVGNVISSSQTCVASILSTVPLFQHQNFRRQRMKIISPMFSHTATDRRERNSDLWIPHPLCPVNVEQII